MIAPAEPSLPSEPPRLSDGDMAELLGAFNDATTKLHAAHESLRGEVGRLQAELRHANEQLERSRRLAALGEMAAGIAHEIRNPLGSIRLYAKMLEDDLRDRDGERSVAQRISGAVRTADAVVRDVLAFAKEVQIHAEPASIDELFTHAIEESQSAMSRGEIRIVRRDRASRIRTVTCDSALMQRALVNVASNAIQAMHEQSAFARTPGRDILTTDAALRTITQADGTRRRCVVLSVSDTGPGIPDEVMQRMFNPFFTTRSAGTGLGLAIVHRIVDAHGGRIAVRNRASADAEHASGATVEILLPAPTPQTSPAAHPEGGHDAPALPRRAPPPRSRVMEDAL